MSYLGDPAGYPEPDKRITVHYPADRNAIIRAKAAHPAYQEAVDRLLASIESGVDSQADEPESD